MDVDVVLCPGHSSCFNRLVGQCQLESFQRALAHVGELAGRRVLDVGCGIGRWTHQLIQRGAHVTGVDIAPDAVKTTRGCCPTVHACVMSATSLGFPDETFDLVTSVTVLQHLPYQDQMRAVTELCRCLARGGFLLLMEQLTWQPVEHGPRTRGQITFARSPEWWIDACAQQGCTLVASDRHLFLPLINNVYLPAEQWMADRLRGLLGQGRRATTPWTDQDRAISQQRSWLGCGEEWMNRACLFLLSLPSYPLEAGLVRGCRAYRWVHQRWLGNHQTFVFRKP